VPLVHLLVAVEVPLVHLLVAVEVPLVHSMVVRVDPFVLMLEIIDFDLLQDHL